MKKSVLIAAVVAVHITGVSAFVLMQGCGTQRPAVEPPPAPVVPPQTAPGGIDPVVSSPVFHPPVAVETAPPAMDWEGTDVYVVGKGDSLSVIANRLGVKTRELADLNNIKDANKIVVGQKLIVPVHSGRTIPEANRPPKKRPSSSAAPTAKVGAGETYVVQKGDMLSRIAVRHGTSVASIKQVNNLKSDKIIVGQKIIMPSGASAPAAKPSTSAVVSSPAPVVSPEPVLEPEPVIMVEEEVSVISVEEPAIADIAPEKAFIYSVAEGDTLESIARSFVVLKEELIEANNMSEGDTVQPGQKLVIPMSP